ncbi:MAG TPA: sensor domain-containing diguanylate cyclase [Acidimicrobiia bacterium]|nr:sensor domain-containing diguanylate cyclase [Acidimicrobiia bacterium]
MTDTMDEQRATLERLRDDTPEMERLSRLTRALADHAERRAEVDDNVGARAAALEISARRHDAVVAAWYAPAGFDPTIGGSDLGVVVIDRGRFEFSNATFDAWFGYAPDEVRELGPLEIAVPDDRPLISEQFRRRLSGEVDRVQYAFRGRRSDGEIIELVCHCTGVRNGGRPRIVGTFMDVTDQVRHECKLIALQEELREQSFHDEVTGLYNRRYVEEMLDERLAGAAAAGDTACLIRAEIDDFDATAEQYGPETADEVVRAYADFLRRQFRPSDVCCRSGTAEFVVLLPGCPHAVGCARAEQLRSLAVTVATSAGAEIQQTASYGAASFPRNGQTVAELLAAAARNRCAADA